MMRLFLCLPLAAAGTCLAADRDPCTVSKLNASTGAYDMLDQIARKVPFDRQNYFLYESQDPVIQKRGAVARLCGNGTERWILYDPAYFQQIRQKDGNSDLPVYFVLAHEAAHHVLDHTLLESNWEVGYWGPKAEGDADHTAAMWVARVRSATREDLLKAFDALGLPEQADPKAGYPSRAERRAKVIQGYQEESASDKPGPAKPANQQVAELKPNNPVETKPPAPPALDRQAWFAAVRAYANPQGLTKFNQQIAGTMSPVLHGIVNKDVKPGGKQVEASGPTLGWWSDLPAFLAAEKSSDTVFVLTIDPPLPVELRAGSQVEFRGIPLKLKREDLASKKTIGNPRNPGTVWSSLNIRFNVRLDDFVVNPESAK